MVNWFELNKKEEGVKWFELNEKEEEELYKHLEEGEGASTDLTLLSYPLPFKVDKPNVDMKKMSELLSDFLIEIQNNNAPIADLIINDFSVDDIVSDYVNMKSIQSNVETIVHRYAVINLLMSDLENFDILKLKKSIEGIVDNFDDYYILEDDNFRSIEKK